METTIVGYEKIWYLLFALLGYSLLVFALMELAIKRDENGNLRARKNNFILKYFFYENLWEALAKNEYTIPKNICNLYWGIFWGLAIMFPFQLFMNSLLIIILTFFAFPFGFLPKLKGDNIIHKYERYGKNDEKKWIAPWKFWIPSLILYNTFFRTDKIVFVINSACETASIVLTSIWLWFVITFLIAVYGIYTAIQHIRKKESWIATKSFLISLKEKTCERILPPENEIAAKNQE